MVQRGLIVLSIVCIGWFYLWTASPEGLKPLLDGDGSSYYNLLARGFLRGQLSLDVPPDPILAAVDDPYDPAQRLGRGMHDATFYKGRFYIYFGVTPVLLANLPFIALTGTFISDIGMAVSFAFGGFLVSLIIFRSVLRVYLPRAPVGIHLAAVWGLGLANLVPPMLRRSAMWEVPITCAYFLFMVTLYLLWRALNSQRPARWLAGASLSLGLCIGARPTYLLSSAILLVPLGFAASNLGRGWWRDRSWWKQAIAAILPILAIGIGLALYNYLRFDNPLEFGQKYQLSGTNENKVVHFRPRFFLFNLYLYFIAAPGFSPYFPFLTVVHPPPVPEGQIVIENPYGIFPTMPWMFLVFAAVGLARQRWNVVGLWCVTAAGGALLVMSVVLFFAGATGRYQVDFTPTLALLAALGGAFVYQVSRRGKGWILGAILVVTGWSAAVNILLSLQHNRLLEVNHPALYRRIAHSFNQLPHRWAKAIGHQDGPVEMRVVFPGDKRNVLEAFVVTGHEFLSDYLFVHHLEPGLIRFGLEHTSRGTWTGPVTRIVPGREYTVAVQMGSLYPPSEHPIYDGLAAGEIATRTRLVKVLLSGRTVLKQELDLYDASDWQPDIGTSGDERPAFKNDFSGRILGWQRIPSLAAHEVARTTGALHLLIRLPAFTRPRSEPLLSTGEPGKGDLIFIKYLDATHYQIGHDRWGYGGSVGPVIGYDPSVPLDLDIACPPLLGEGTPPRLVISLNGSPLLDVEEAFHPSEPAQVVVGRNPIGASTAEAEFTGVIEIQERVVP